MTKWFSMRMQRHRALPMLINLENATKQYPMGQHIVQALRGIHLKIDSKEVVALVGASGSGKSTTMHILGLLDLPSTGTYLLNGQDVSTLSNNALADLRNQSMGFIFQQFFLLPKLSAVENVELPLRYRQTADGNIREQALTMLEKVGMRRYATHRPSELSGGQQQRVAIARALINNPKIILADEPTGALDSKTSEEVIRLLLNLHKDNDCTVILVTHDMQLAKRCNRIVQIRDGLVLHDSAVSSDSQKEASE